MKKTIIGCIVAATFAANAQYMIIASGVYESTSYEATDWSVVASTCVYDLETSDVYYDKSFNRTKSCSTEERTITKTVLDSDGNKTTKTEVESRPYTGEDILEVAVGTHLEASCKNALAFDNSFLNNDGIYKVSNLGERDVYCDMSTDNGGWTMVAAMANDGNDYWVFNTDLYWNARDYGTPSSRNSDYQSVLWGSLVGNDVLIADSSKSKYAIYSSIISNQTLQSKYNSNWTNSSTYNPSKKGGSWWSSSCDSDNSLDMRTFSLDSDSSSDHKNASHSRGFVWMSVNNGGCYWDDTYGGISKSSNSGSSIKNLESWATNQFYTKNFSPSNAMNVFIR